jgi:hypothetical protein
MPLIVRNSSLDTIRNSTFQIMILNWCLIICWINSGLFRITMIILIVNSLVWLILLSGSYIKDSNPMFTAGNFFILPSLLLTRSSEFYCDDINHLQYSIYMILIMITFIITQLITTGFELIMNSINTKMTVVAATALFYIGVNIFDLLYGCFNLIRVLTEVDFIRSTEQLVLNHIRSFQIQEGMNQDHVKRIDRRLSKLRSPNKNTNRSQSDEKVNELLTTLTPSPELAGKLLPPLDLASSIPFDVQGEILKLETTRKSIKMMSKMSSNTFKNQILVLLRELDKLKKILVIPGTNYIPISKQRICYALSESVKKPILHYLKFFKFSLIIIPVVIITNRGDLNNLIPLIGFFYYRINDIVNLIHFTLFKLRHPNSTIMMAPTMISFNPFVDIIMKYFCNGSYAYLHKSSLINRLNYIQFKYMQGMLISLVIIMIILINIPSSLWWLMIAFHLLDILMSAVALKVLLLVDYNSKNGISQDKSRIVTYMASVDHETDESITINVLNTIYKIGSQLDSEKDTLSHEYMWLYMAKNPSVTIFSEETNNGLVDILWNDLERQHNTKNAMINDEDIY